ncbi:MAG: hypothetical protein C3F06_13045 [Candidatus Methanoperedenaceae archaeon]|nr:MAG: hypothetical protein C3F06_13045 [Candidatus Methanoperedenaceae archaeon]
MKILLSIEHPAWAHQFRHMIRELEKKGHIIKVVAINKDRDLELLDIFNIEYDIISNTSGKNLFEKGIIFLKTTFKIYQISKQFKPDMYIGRASPMMSINSFLFRKNHIIFEDTEHSTFCLFIAKLFTDVIITPNCFKNNLGRKQFSVDAYKELFYLHPNYFTPNPNVLSELNLSTQDKFIILRFVAWDAHHDIGQQGIKGKIEFVKKLEKYCRVLISSEGKLDKELDKYKIVVSPEKLHDLLYYATLYVGEGSTTASECAILGTHAIYINTLRLGYTEEEETKYNLVYNFSDKNTMEKQAFDKALELLENKDLRNEGKKKRERLLKDKIDVTAFMIKFIENYP